MIKTMYLISARYEIPLNNKSLPLDWQPQYILDCDGDAAIVHCQKMNMLRYSLPPLVRMIYTYIMLEVRVP